MIPGWRLRLLSRDIYCGSVDSSPAVVSARALYLAKAFARYVRWLPADSRRGASGKSLLPPQRLSFVGKGDFERTGQEYLAHFRDLGQLQTNDRVLDIGCGIGRMAIPLMDYFDSGSYAGFDVGKAMIRWCQRNISAQRPDFEFSWAPTFNRKYSPFGSIRASEYRFPYPDSSFDFSFATSVFTHLVRDDARHYLKETARVLQPGKLCLLTFFLLTDAAEREMHAGRASFNFQFAVDGGLAVDSSRPEEAIAYRPDAVRAMLTEAGLELQEPIHNGRWANNPNGLTGQDILIARRIT